MEAKQRLRHDGVPLWNGGIGLLYWAAFYLFAFSDLYLTLPSVGFALKLLAPLFLVVQLIAIGLALASWPRGKRLASGGLVLNTLPVIGAVAFVWWLFFGVRI